MKFIPFQNAFYRANEVVSVQVDGKAVKVLTSGLETAFKFPTPMDARQAAGSFVNAIEEAFGQCSKPQQNKVRVWLINFGPDERINKTMKLTKPIKPGFRRPFTITPDEPVDSQGGGAFYRVEIISGDSTVTIDPASTATSLKGYLNGDGATGDKAIRIVADGHVGEGDQPVSLDVEYTVNTPDATSLAAFVEGTDEPIPA